MEVIATTKKNTIIVEFTEMELDALEGVLNAVSVYGRKLIDCNVPGYSEPDFEHYFERTINPTASRFWLQIYNAEKSLSFS